MNMLHIDIYAHIYIYNFMHNITCIYIYTITLNINNILYFVMELTVFVTELTFYLFFTKWQCHVLWVIPKIYNML